MRVKVLSLADFFTLYIQYSIFICTKAIGTFTSVLFIGRQARPVDWTGGLAKIVCKIVLIVMRVINCTEPYQSFM